MTALINSETPTSRYNIHNNQKNIKPAMDNNDQLENWLLRIANDRDRLAFSELFNWFSPIVFRVAKRKLSNEALAKEIVQETLTNIWRKSHLFNIDKGKPSTWVYTVMRNVIFDTLRKMKTKQKECLSEDIYPDFVDHQEAPESFSDHLQDAKMQKLVDALPIAQKEVVRAIYFHELTQEQLAKQLNIPLGTVKSRLRLALSKLKDQLGGNHD